MLPRRVLGALALAGSLLVAGCGAVEPSSARTTAPIAIESPVEGVVVDVDAAGLTDVGGFRVRTADGGEIAFTVGEIENAVEFPPSHLASHVVDATPIRVYFRRIGDELFVYRLEDGSVPPP